MTGPPVAGGPPRTGSASPGVVVTGLVVLAGIIDGFVLLPTFEAGGGSPVAAWASWLGVNLAPAAVGAALWRREGRDGRTALRLAMLTLAATALVIAIVLVLYMGGED